jgi:hypothetical protein
MYASVLTNITKTAIVQAVRGWLVSRVAATRPVGVDQTRINSLQYQLLWNI